MSIFPQDKFISDTPDKEASSGLFSGLRADDAKSVEGSRETDAAAFTHEQFAGGLHIERVFSEEGRSPFDTLAWDRRDAAIRNQQGEAVFEQKEVAFPESWSPLATNVVASKYFYGDVEQSGTDPSKGGARTHSGSSFIASRARLPTGERSNIISPPRKTANASTMNLPGFACINTAHSTVRYGSMSACISSTVSAIRAARRYPDGMKARAGRSPWIPTGARRLPPASSYRWKIPSTISGS